MNDLGSSNLAGAVENRDNFNLSAIFDTELENSFRLLQKMSNELKVDVSSYYDEIVGIRDNTFKKIDDIRNNNALEQIGRKMLISQAYESGIYSLKKMSEKLGVYNVYFNVLKKCRDIEPHLNMDMSEDEITNLSREIILCLNAIKSSENIDDFANEKEAIDILYRVAYTLMKLDFLHDGESRIYNYAIRNRMDILRFSELISQDIMNNKYSDKVKNAFRQLDSFNGNNICLDKELLRAMINEMALEVKLERNLKKKYKKEISKLSKKYVKSVNKKKKSDSFTKDLISGVILPSAILGTGLITPAVVVSNYEGRTEHNITNEIHEVNDINELSNYDYKSNTYVQESSENKINSSSLVIYEPWTFNETNGNYTRKVGKLDISNLSEDDVIKMLQNPSDLMKSITYVVESSENPYLGNNDISYAIENEVDNEVTHKLNFLGKVCYYVYLLSGICALYLSAVLIADKFGGYIPLIKDIPANIRYIKEHDYELDKDTYDKIKNKYGILGSVRTSILNDLKENKELKKEYSKLLNSEEYKSLLDEELNLSDFEKDLFDSKMSM